MSDRDPMLQAAFAEAALSLTDEEFAQDLRAKIDKAHRRLMLQRIALGVLVALVTLPLQDVGLAVARLFMLAVVDIEAGLAAILLAPINTVGGVLSLILFLMRYLHRWIFRGAG